MLTRATKLHHMMKQSLPLFRYQYQSFGIVEDIEKKLKESFNPEVLKINDQVGDMSKEYIKILIVSEKFKGMLPLQRHGIINEVLKEEFKQVHSVSIDARPPPAK